MGETVAIFVEAGRYTLTEPRVTAETIRGLVRAPYDDRVFRERPSDEGDEEIVDGVTVDVVAGDRFWTMPREARSRPRSEGQSVESEGGE